MDEQAAIAALRALSGDPEGDHKSAELILVEALRSAGLPTLADEFMIIRTGFWYS